MNQHKLPYRIYLLSSLLSFYVASCILLITSFLIEARPNIVEIAFALLGGWWVSLVITCTFFLPILLIISIITWLINHKVRYALSFILMELYGYLLFIVPVSGENQANSGWLGGEISNYFLTSIPSTILFMILLTWFIGVFSRRHWRKLEQDKM